MSKEDFANHQLQQDIEVGKACAMQLASRYQGNKCMGTTLNACVPDKSDVTREFQ